MEYPTLQELFDSIAYMPASHQAMYMECDAVANKHHKDIVTVGFTDEYFDDLGEVAEKYGVQYANPKYKAGLKPVDTRPTVH